jgi:uncharacterized protein (DUF697 family)
MPSLNELGSIFKTLREIDLQAIADEAQQQTWLGIVGNEQSGAHDLATALYLSPRPLPPTDASRAMAGPILVPLDQLDLADRADLISIVLDPAQPIPLALREAFQKWVAASKPIVVILNQATTGEALLPIGEWMGARVLRGQVVQREFLEQQFVPAVLQFLPERKLALARNYPLFRVAVAHEIINETCVANAGYSFSTGIAEIIPAFTIPFNVADMIILTKAQAFMVYRLGLIFGLSTRWQDHLGEFGSTIGFGFVWRTIARQLVGLIPGFGVLPKTAIAYAGTYAVGRGALEWYLTGREVKRGDLERYFREALERGKQFAATLAARAPKATTSRLTMPRLPFGRKKEKPLELTAGDADTPNA